MSTKFKISASIIQYLIGQSQTSASIAWVKWRETVLAIYEGEVQGGVIDAEINTGKSEAKKIKSVDELKGMLDLETNDTAEVLSHLELFRITFENSSNYIPGTFNIKLFEEIRSLLSIDPSIQQNATDQADKWFRLKEENKFFTEVYVPASIRPVILDFILRSLVLWLYQNWGWELLNDNAIPFFWAIQVTLVPGIILSYALIRDKRIIRSTQNLIKQIKIENIKIRIKNNSWHYLFLFMLIILGSVITFSVSILQIDLLTVVVMSIVYGIYLLILQTNFSKQSPTYSDIKQQIEDKEHRELSGELTPDQNDEEIVNLEVNLKAENERMNAYVIEAALFGALAFSGYLQLVSEGGISIATVLDFNHHIMRVISNLIDTPVKNIAESYAFLLSKSGIFALISYQLLLCSIFFLAVIASRLRFSRLTDYIDRFLQLSKAMNVKEENLVLNDKNNTEGIDHYNRKIKELLKKGYKKQDEINPIMEYMQFFRTLGVVMFFIIIITGGLFISTWISIVLLFISILSLVYFHFGKFRDSLKLFNIKMQEFYYKVNHTIHWVCWSMILLALILRSFAISGGALMAVVGFTLLFLHYMMNLFIPVQFDYKIKGAGDVFGSTMTYHKILAIIFKIALPLFFLSFMLKGLRLGGAGVLLSISAILLSIFFFLVPKFKSENSWKEYILGLAISATLLAILFKTMHWLGASVLIGSAYILIPISVILVYFNRNQVRPLIKRTILILFVLLIGVISPYIRSAIISLNFNYKAYEQVQRDWQVRRSMWFNKDELISIETLGTDSMQIIMDAFNNSFVNINNPDHKFLNSWAWEVYLQSEDSILLRNALMWSEKTIEYDRNWIWLDTYAALLYKNRMYEEAKIYAVEAYELGKDEVTKALIDDIDSVLAVKNKAGGQKTTD